MSSIAALIGVVCACSLAVSLLTVLSPNGMTNKVLSIVTGAFILCVMILPLKDFAFDLSLDIPSVELSDEIASQAQDAYNSAVITQTQSYLEQSALSKLLSKGYSVKSAEIELDSNDNNGIYIRAIRIYIDKTENRVSKIIGIIRDEFNITPEIITRQ